MKKYFIVFFLFSTMHSSFGQEVIPLYQTVPNGKPSVKRERSEVTAGAIRVYGVIDPTLTVYQAVSKKANGAAVIICPGGGYSRLSITHEGYDVAKVFNEWGITAFVLKYRLPDDSIMIDKTIGPLQDAQRAIQIVRENAAKWNIDPHRIGIMGFSAGGHLAATTSTHYEQAVIDNPGAVSLRPDFSILIYPVISFADSIMHKGSRDNLLGLSPSSEKIATYSNELQVSQKTPPTFLVHASDDKSVVPANSIVYYQALLINKVAAELHIYQKGGHGFGMKNNTTNDQWMERLKNWMESNRLLQANP